MPESARGVCQSQGVRDLPNWQERARRLGVVVRDNMSCQWYRSSTVLLALVVIQTSCGEVGDRCLQKLVMAAVHATVPFTARGPAAAVLALQAAWQASKASKPQDALEMQYVAPFGIRSVHSAGLPVSVWGGLSVIADEWPAMAGDGRVMGFVATV